MVSYGVGAVIGSEAANLIYYWLFWMNLKGESNNAFHIYSKYFALMLSSMDMNFPYMHIYIISLLDILQIAVVSASSNIFAVLGML